MRSSARIVRVLLLSMLLSLGFGQARAASAGDDPASGHEQAPDGASDEIAAWAHPPVNLRGGYTLDRGEVLLSYRFERRATNELQNGQRRLSAEDVLDLGYTSAPRSIDIDRHVFSALWSPIDELTFQVDLPFVTVKADRIHRPTGPDVESFRTTTKGFGDVLAWVLYRVYRDDIASLHLNLGLSFPSGSIRETQDTALTPDGVFERLPYVLQLGSGTVDLEPGFTYRGRYRQGQWGLQALATLRAGRNHQEYTLGNEYEVTGYGAWAWSDWLEQSFSLKWVQRFDGSGSDPSLDPTQTPLADASLLSGRRLDALFGLAVKPTGGLLRHSRWVLDAGLPAYQYLDGPQPRTKWLLQFAVEFTLR